ncbi:MAG: ABC transporter permease [Deltaproteobacteria bacterium]|nr:ABC transporter permease [Deltaproteobacteria bacterium]
MSEDSALQIDENAPRVTALQRFVNVFFGRKIVVFGLVVIIILVLAAVFAPFVAPFDPYEQNLLNTKATPSWEHPLGTDTLGRDTLSRIIYGARTSLQVGILAILVSSSIGMLLGLTAGYFGGWTNTIIMRVMDALMSFPPIMMALMVASLLEGGIYSVIVALSVGMIPPYARVMCGQALHIKENDYVLAGKAIGATNKRVMFRHVAPNCFPPLIVMMTMSVGRAILAEAGLSYLGIGIKPPGAAWGAMVSEGYSYLETFPILSFAPGIAIMIVVFAFNMVGDGLRDALDPRLRGTL